MTMKIAKKHLILPLSLIVFVSCLKPIATTVIQLDNQVAQQKAKQAKEKGSIQIADGLKIDLWAADTLSPDPVSIEMDNLGRAYITRTNRQKNSEFDIRGHRDWMTASISLETVEERRAFLRKTFAPEKSKENAWVKDLNEDGIHDWKDLAVERDEIWRIEDKDGDGIAETSTRVFEGPNDEVTDVAGGLLIREKDAFWCTGPDMWRLTDKNKDGIYETKESISHGYAVHIGFGGHGMSGAVEGPDGKIYWQIGDIGANIVDKTGKKHEYPNEGVLVRSNPDGSDFEVVSHGIRNTHEFVFDDYGNILSSDNDGDHAGESERLVHLVEGSDFGWRSNWQYGKYTDPRNNGYNVWMKERLYQPRWDGQAAYIIPPIQNFHNGPTGMLFNPGTALGKDWLRKFFLVEFVGTTTGSHIWSFGLKPKGATFVLDGDKKLTTGILPTGIRFGPDGALYAGDWIQGWDTKNYGKIWKIDVKDDKNDLAAQRTETKRLIQLDYAKQPDFDLERLLSYTDMRIRMKAQFELVKRKSGLSILKRQIQQKENQFARIHSIWGIGQLAEKDLSVASNLTTLLNDSDEEIIAQALKVMGDVEYEPAGDNMIILLNHQNPRIRFFAAQALGRIKYQPAVGAIIKMIEANNDEDVYIRHAGVLALSRIGQTQPIEELLNSPNRSLRIASVLVLRKWRSPFVAKFLNDSDEYIATEAARAINDDLSIKEALPALAQMLNQKKFNSEPLIRRAINAALRVGTEKELDALIAFAERNDISDEIRAEALSTIGTWANPSVLDRVDGRNRGEIKRDIASVNAKVKSRIKPFLSNTNPVVLTSTVRLLSELGISDYNNEIAELFKTTENTGLRSATISALSNLNYADIQSVIKAGMEDKNRDVRTTAIGLLNKLNVNKDNLPSLTNPIFEKGSTQEQQQLLKVLGEMPIDNTRVVFEDLMVRMTDAKLDNKILLDLIEAAENTKDDALKTKIENLRKQGTETDKYVETLYGGNRQRGREVFYNNSAAQCVRCHAIGNDGGANVGPNLKGVGDRLTRELILQSLIEPSAKIADGFGNVTLQLTDNQEVTGILMHEKADEIQLKTSEAEPLKIPTARIKKRDYAPSAMPTQGGILSKREIRDLVEYLVSLK
jgi:quinoprotein glucose dehydrogenase